MTQAIAPRLMVAAPASGSGKTTFVCGLLRLLQRKGLDPRACKCGPDFIDPMFHRKVIGVASRNLDLFLSGEQDVRRLLAQGASASRVTVIEGVMGYFDGIGMSDRASSWDVARRTQTPTVLVVDCRGRALTVASEVLGILRMREPSQVVGVVLNRVSSQLYPRLKEAIEDETGVSVLGYVPMLEDCVLESRHLGLVTAGEVARLGEKIDRVADALEGTLDLDAILAAARLAPPLSYEKRSLEPVASPAVRIAVARDEAFCFYYEDALDTLRELGVEPLAFSPLHDAALPEGACGLYLGGGYPELHAAALEKNEAMRAAVARAVRAGMPTIAECGGFMYLNESLEDQDGSPHQMAGVIHARAYKTGHLRRFGYVSLTAKGESLLAEKGDVLRAHEFHYWDSDDPGACFLAEKPLSTRSWECVHATPTLYAGYPHIELASAPKAARRFVAACARYRAKVEVSAS